MGSRESREGPKRRRDQALNIPSGGGGSSRWRSRIRLASNVFGVYFAPLEMGGRTADLRYEFAG
jgi:hypothetical protein